MKRLTVAAALKHLQTQPMLLVFPLANRKDIPSLWTAFFPRTPMRWEWDQDGDSRVADLWHLREQLSSSGRVIYTKFFRGRATLIALELFPYLLRLVNPEFPALSELTSSAAGILDLLNEDSPISTKQLKRLADLQGKDNEPRYNLALKELWSHLLISIFGEVDEGAFPSVALGATRILFEEVWIKAANISVEDAWAKAETLAPPFQLMLQKNYKFRRERQAKAVQLTL